MHGGLLSHLSHKYESFGTVIHCKTNLKPPASCIGYILIYCWLYYQQKNTWKSERKPPESHRVITPSNPGLKVEDRIRRQLSLECFEFPECRSWWCAKLPKLWRDVRTTVQYFAQSPHKIRYILASISPHFAQLMLHWSPDMSTACMTISSPRRQARPKGHSERDVPNEMGLVPPQDYGLKHAQR